MLGEVPITLEGGVARRPDGTIAGGASTLLHGLRRLCALSVDLPEALEAVTEGPARPSAGPTSAISARGARPTLSSWTTAWS